MNELAKNPETGMVIMDIPDELDGLGTEQLTSEDRSIAWFKLLQGGNPEIKTARCRVEGAIPGMFYNTATGELFDGEDGSAEITICTTERYFVEWGSEESGGGFVGKHSPESPIVREAIAYSKQEDIWPIQRPNGNELTDTRYLYVLAGKSLDPAVFAISSKKLRTYKDLMADHYKCRVETPSGEKKQPPLCSVLVKCTSFDDVGQGHDFKNLIMEPAINNDIHDSLLPLDDPRVVAGIKVVEQFKASSIKVDYAGERNAEVIDVKAKSAF